MLNPDARFQNLLDVAVLVLAFADSAEFQDFRLRLPRSQIRDPHAHYHDIVLESDWGQLAHHYPNTLSQQQP
jgi:hypothetical protein